MNKKKILLITFSIAVIISSCQSNEEKVKKVWFFSEADFSDENDQILQAEQNHIILSPESFLDLQKDGTYTSFFGSFVRGEWTLTNDQLVLNSKKNNLEFEIRSAGKNELKLYYPLRKAEYLFEGFKNEFASQNENPFSAVNNKWRLKASKRESDTEISYRLKNHFRFQEKYFAWGNKNELQVLDVNSTASPLKIYSNGFELIHYTQQRYEWKKLFYDSADYKKAFEKIYYIFQTDKINWIKTNNKFKMFASAFQQLQEKITTISPDRAELQAKPKIR